MYHPFKAECNFWL